LLNFSFFPSPSAIVARDRVESAKVVLSDLANPSLKKIKEDLHSRQAKDDQLLGRLVRLFSLFASFLT